MLKVRLQPLVGPSLVAGSLALLDIQQNGASAAPDTLDTIKARRHVEVPIGHSKTWTVPKKDLQGPRDGWWYVDTNDDPTQSLGPALNSWFYGQTYNLLGTTNDNVSQYSGACFLLELTVKYAFSNYTPKPGLATLSKEVKDNQIAINFANDIDGSLVIQVPNGFSRYIERDTEKNGALGSTFWAISSQVINTVAESFGPWGWVFRAGWLVVRKIFGAPHTKEGVYYLKVYASAEDAARDAGMFVNGTGITLPKGIYRIEQLTSANLNSNTQPNAYAAYNYVETSYLPLAEQGAPSADVPPFYNFLDDTYIKFDPPWSGGTKKGLFNGNALLMASKPRVHFWGSDDTVTKLTFQFVLWNNGGTARQYDQAGRYHIAIEFGRAAFWMGDEIHQTYGIMHSYNSFDAALTTLWSRLDQEALQQLKDTSGKKGNFATKNDKTHGASYWKLPVAIGGQAKEFANSLGVDGFYAQGRPILGLSMCYLSGHSPWEPDAGHKWGENAFFIWDNNKWWLFTASNISPEDWKYKGPLWAATYATDTDPATTFYTLESHGGPDAKIPPSIPELEEQVEEDLEDDVSLVDELEDMVNNITRGDLEALMRRINPVPKRT